MEKTENPLPAAVAIAIGLMRRESVTPEDGGALDWAAARLAPQGFACRRFDRNGVKNLWARRGEAAPLFCFAGHVDVVPPGKLAAWQSPPFAPEIRGGMLYGRGAADMKGGLAAMLAAAEAFIAENPGHAGSIAFLLTSDEEGDATDGTVHVVEQLQAEGAVLDFCLVGEPTSVSRLGDMAKIGRRGSLSGRLVARGRQCHIAYPDLGVNPIHRLAPALCELVQMQWDEGNAEFQPTSFQVSNIHAGVGANNVVPGELEMLFNFRFSTESTPEALQSRTEAILQKHGLDYTLKWTLGARPFLMPRGKLAAAASRAIEAECGISPEFSTTGGTSDGRFLAAISREMLELGPSNATSHQIDECVKADDLPRLAQVYQRILASCLGEAG